MTARVHVIGRKNSGKTTLVVDLVRYWTERGILVGTIKHTHHRHELDVPGKDSYRHREAGASPVAILSPGMSAVFRPRAVGGRAEEEAWLAPIFAGCRLILVEGDSQTTFPKVEVWRSVTGTTPMSLEDPSIRAIVTDDPVDVAQPTWRRSDLEILADRLLTLADGR